MGGANLDLITGIAVDSDNAVYVTGQTGSTDFPTVGAFQSFVTVSDGFIMKLNAACRAISHHAERFSTEHRDPQGSTILFSTYLGGRLEDTIWAAALNAGGDLYVGGNTNSTDFPVANALQPESAGKSDAFLALVHSKVDTTEQKL